MTTRLISIIAAAAAALTLVSTQPASADAGDCGQPQSTGSAPTATDALAVLKGAVGLGSACDSTPCICDVNGDGNVTSSDALAVLQAAVGTPIALACDCEEVCVTFGSGAVGLQSTAGFRSAIDVGPRQVMIETKFIAIDLDSFDELGIDSQMDLASSITASGQVPAGGTNGDGRTLAVDSNAIGGPADLQYLLYGNHNPDGALAILNPDFVSPFDAVKTFFLLPSGCNLFEESAVSEPQGFPGVTPVDNVAPFDAGFGGGELLYTALGANDATALLDAVENDNRNVVLSAPNVTAFGGQSVIHMVDDVEPSINQLPMDFKDNIQAVTPNPFGNFTGVALDVTPTIQPDDTITLTIRPSTQAVSFFFSTAFQVGGVSMDAEIPVLRRSTNTSTLMVPTGQTIVIGGLLRSGQTTPERGVPILGDLPLVGSLFSHKHFDPVNRTLIIFVTANLVNPG